jgi:hypothetical protein
MNTPPLVRIYAARCSKWPHALAMHKRARIKAECVAFLRFHDCFVWELNHPWCAVRTHLVSAISSNTPRPHKQKSRLSSLANGVARRADLHDQSNDFQSTDSSTVWLVDWNDVERRRIWATCLTWPGEERLPKWMVARPEGNPGVLSC